MEPEEPRDTDPQRKPNRRILFGSFAGLGAAALAGTGMLWSAAVGRFLMPNVQAEPSRRFIAGRADAHVPGRVDVSLVQRHGIFLVCNRIEGRVRIVALRAGCTHLGCIVRWQARRRRFACPCHGSEFSFEGLCRRGPAGRPLERVAVRLTPDGRLEVDTSRVFRQERGEWSDPSSYAILG